MAKKQTSRSKNGVLIESIRHKDERKNIPAEELHDFVAEDENAPKTKLYPRDPSLDPQLIWKGKVADSLMLLGVCRGQSRRLRPVGLYRDRRPAIAGNTRAVLQGRETNHEIV